LYPLIEEVAPLEAILNQYKIDFETKSLQMMKSKLGLYMNDKEDVKLIQDLEDCLQLTETDMTIFFRNLSDFEGTNFFEILENAFYTTAEVSKDIKEKWEKWFQNYDDRLQKESLNQLQRKEKMDAVNPKYVLRNYMAQLAIDAADNGDYSLINELFQLLKKPYSEQPKYEKWFAKRPEWAKNKVGCSMLSCSS